MKKILLLLSLVSAVAVIGGCSGKDKESEAVAIDAALTPEKVVEEVLRGFQSGEPEGLAAYFSPSIDKEAVESFLKKKSAGTAVLQYVARPAKVSKSTAEVPYEYYSRKKDKQGATIADSPRLHEKFTARLVKQEEGWKIVRFEPSLDRKIEKDLFLGCVKTVALARLAQEQYKAKNGTFTTSLSGLKQYTDFDSSVCRGLDVKKVDSKGFEIVAFSKTDPACRIKADRDAIKPLKFSSCPAAIKPKAKPAVAAKKPAAQKPAAPVQPAVLEAKEVRPEGGPKVVIEQNPGFSNDSEQ